MFEELPQKENLVAIARVTKTRGIRGELVAETLTDFPERFAQTKRVFSVDPKEQVRKLDLEKFWFHKDKVILKFVGVDSIEQARGLVGCEICIHESEVVELSEDEFFDWQLIGCIVETVENQRIGEVIEIMRTAATEILVVQGEKKDYLIPFVGPICVEVDVENKLILVDPPEGLLDF